MDIRRDCSSLFSTEGTEGMTQPTAQLEAHLTKNGINHEDLPDEAIVALNKLSADDLQHLDDAAESMKKAKVPENKLIMTFH